MFLKKTLLNWRQEIGGKKRKETWGNRKHQIINNSKYISNHNKYKLIKVAYEIVWLSDWTKTKAIFCLLKDIPTEKWRETI